MRYTATTRQRLFVVALVCMMCCLRSVIVELQREERIRRMKQPGEDHDQIVLSLLSNSSSSSSSNSSSSSLSPVRARTSPLSTRTGAANVLDGDDGGDGDDDDDDDDEFSSSPKDDNAVLRRPSATVRQQRRRFKQKAQSKGYHFEIRNGTSDGTRFRRDGFRPNRGLDQRRSVNRAYARHLSPIVVERYKLVFVAVPKVACTAWKLLFTKIAGHSPETPTKKSRASQQLRWGDLHLPHRNYLKYLFQCNRTYAKQIMLDDPTWTRAVFVRNPHERLLSAYLDKEAEIKEKCHKKTGGVPIHTFEDFVTKALPKCRDQHWIPQSHRLRVKDWAAINFVGHMDHLAEDAKRLLQQIGAWEEHGMTGWGKDGKQPFLGISVSDGDESGAQHHATNSRDKLRQYYGNNTALYDRVTELYYDDYAFPLFNFSAATGARHRSVGPAIQKLPAR